MKKVLTTPVKAEDLEDLKAGDIIYVSGTLATGRDDVYHRVVRENMTSPYDFDGGVNFHAGPIVRETPEGNFLVSVGPTSSIRMDADASEFIRKTGLKIMIGKGGMGDKTTEACAKYKAIHCVFVGGCAVSATTYVEKIENVYWRELGMPECEWVMKVREFGPLIVSIDTHGNNLFVQNKAKYAARKEECEAPIIDSVKDYMTVE